MIPNKLQIGDEIRVIAPARGMKLLSEETINIAKSRIEDLGFNLTYGRNVFNCDENFSSSVEDRVSDISDAFSDKNVKAILTVIGGYNSNQILDYLDYEIIRKNPKIICGYSDITALLSAINTQTGLVTYLGPHFSSFGMKYGFEYTIENFKDTFMNQGDYEIKSSNDWSDDLWFADQEKREFIKNEGIYFINEGSFNGELVGGNISTFCLLSGTKYFPDLSNKVLMLEAHSEVKDVHFDRLLQSLIQQPNFKKIKGLIIGMFQKESKISKEKLLKIIKSKRELENVPVVANANFGHITPIITLPIGGNVNLSLLDKEIQLKILQ